MDSELQTRLDRLEQKIDAALAAAERARKYLWWMAVISIALIVLPAIGIVFALPSFLSTYSSMDVLYQ